MSEYLTWEFLGTFAGVVAVVVLIVQFLKLPLDKVWKIPTRYLVWVISLIILVAVEAATGTFEVQRIILLVLNSIIVTMAAIGTHESTIRKLE
jgi:beta-lactamase regulating signal transducer with metallopeptidase domain